VATDVSRIRTIAITGQSGVGKTSVADALVFAAGGNNRLGRVDDESSLFDTEPEEIRRRSTITSSLHGLSWDKHSITVIDTPGQGNFVLDALFSLRGVAAMVLVIDPLSPLQAETLKVWKWAKEEGIPSIAVLNRLDRPEIDLDGCLAQITESLGIAATLVQQPIGLGEDFSGVVNLLNHKAYTYAGEDGKFAVGAAPDDLSDAVELAQATLTEAAAEGDDELLEKYLEDGELSDADIAKGLAAAIAGGGVLPVFCVSAAQNVGFPQLLDGIVELLPAPSTRAAESAKAEDGSDTEVAPSPDDPFSAFVFKTIVDPHAGHLSVLRVMSGTLSGDTQVINSATGNKERVGHLLRVDGKKTAQVDSATVGEIVAVAKLKATRTGQTLADPARAVKIRELPEVTPAISFAIGAKKRGDEDKATQGLLRLAEEDLALHVERDESSGEILVSGAGQLHVEVSCDRLQRKYGVEVELKAPKVPYRETIRKSVKAHGRLKKQTGGHGQFADCKIEVEPLPRGSGFEFEAKIVGGSIPRGFIPAVEKGVADAMKNGTVAGCQVVDVKVRLYDGQYHDVDSSEMAFKVAGSMAMKDALEQAKPCLLEPFVSMQITVPDECMGDVMGDLNSRRAKVEGMDQAGHNQIIRAKVPMAEVLRYAPDLTSMTSGRGSFEMGFSHYEQLPDHLVDKAVQDSKGGAAAG
jgi:elongation factor G